MSDKKILTISINYADGDGTTKNVEAKFSEPVGSDNMATIYEVIRRFYTTNQE